MVKVNIRLSEPLTLSTGTPQGYVLSPPLFTHFTNDCRSNSNSALIFKFSDDTITEGLTTNADESAYGKGVGHLVDWCANNDPELNVAKTKEMIIDFRKDKTAVTPLAIKGQYVKIVNPFKSLGTTVANTLKLESPTTHVLSEPTKKV